MPREVNGVDSILRDAFHMCRMVERFGTSALTLWTSEDFALAVQALVTACAVIKTIDDHVGQIDRTAGGYRDGVPE